MRYLYERGKSKRRVMHLCGYSPTTGEPTMRALCGSRLPFDSTISVPLGKRVCIVCRRAATQEGDG
jgi:hypothetical protein